MAYDAIANLLETTLGAPRATGSATFTVKAGDGSRFGTFSSLLFAATPASNLASSGRIMDRTKVAYYRATGRTGDDLTGCTLIEGTDQGYDTGDLLGVFIAAQHITQLRDAIDAATGRLDTDETHLGNIDTQITGIDTRLDGLDSQATSLDSRVDAIEATLHLKPSGGDDSGAIRSAALAAGSGTLELDQGVFLLASTLDLSGVACTIKGQGPGTILRHQAGQSGPVVNLSGYTWYPNFEARRKLSGFRVEGDGTAGAAKKGIDFGTAGGSGAILEDISIGSTGGTPLELGYSTCCDFLRITISDPVDAATGDIPYIHAAGPFNGNRLQGITLRALGTGANVGATGAAVFRSDSQFAPTTNLFLAWSFEYLHLPSGGTFFACEGDENTIMGFQFFDSGQVSGATETSYFRFLKSSVNWGSNLFWDLIPGRQPIAESPSYGIDCSSSGNSFVGVRGQADQNIIFRSGSARNMVHFTGARGGLSGSGVVDSSGVTTNIVVDHTQGDGSHFSGTIHGSGLDLSGTVTASGTSHKLGFLSVYSESRALPTAVADCVAIGAFSGGFGSGSIDLFATVEAGGIVIGKRFLLTTYFAETGTTWVECAPIADTGTYGLTDNFSIDAQVNGGQIALRARRTLGSNPATLRVVLLPLVGASTIWTPDSSTSTGVTAPTSYLGGGGPVIHGDVIADGGLRLTGYQLERLSRTISGTVGDTVELCTYAISPAGAGLVRLAVAVNSGGFSFSQFYNIPISYDGTGGAWQSLAPLATTPAYGGTNSIAADIKIAASTTTLRLRRSGLSAEGGTAIVIMTREGDIGTYTASSTTATGVAAPTAEYTPSRAALSIGQLISGAVAGRVVSVGTGGVLANTTALTLSGDGSGGFDVVISTREAADDAAAAALTPAVPVGGIYRTGSALKVRVT